MTCRGRGEYSSNKTDEAFINSYKAPSLRLRKISKIIGENIDICAASQCDNILRVFSVDSPLKHYMRYGGGAFNAKPDVTDGGYIRLAVLGPLRAVLLG